MTRPDVVRAWKDPHYRDHLHEAGLQDVPSNPAGELDQAIMELTGGAGGGGPIIITCIGICPSGLGACGSVGLTNCSFFGCQTSEFYYCPFKLPDPINPQ